MTEQRLQWTHPKPLLTERIVAWESYTIVFAFLDSASTTPTTDLLHCIYSIGISLFWLQVDTVKTRELRSPSCPASLHDYTWSVSTRRWRIWLHTMLSESLVAMHQKLHVPNTLEYPAHLTGTHLTHILYCFLHLGNPLSNLFSSSVSRQNFEIKPLLIATWI